MSDILLPTKLHIPPLQNNLVHRQHLIERLNEAVRQGCHLALISAPAGYGKSTLLNEWVHQLEEPVAWLSLDKGDNSPSRFWTYFLASLQSIPDLKENEKIEEILLELTQTVQFQSEESVLAKLVAVLADFPKRFILVLDDLHLVTEAQVYDGILFLLEQLSRSQGGLYLVVASRIDPPWPLARLRVRAELNEVRTKDLRFSPEEAATFLNEIMALRLASEEIALLEKRTEGWVAGLQMAGLSLQGREDAYSYIHSFSGENRFILDFLFEEVFQRQSTELQKFLLQTSILERLSGSLCDQVTLQENSQSILENLERCNLFLISLDEQKKWFRYHHLFGDLLKRRLAQVFPDSIAPLHQRASLWYEAEHDLESSVTHALAARDFERAAGLVEQVFHYLDMPNQQSMLTFWVDQLPREILENHPWLCVYRAWGYYWVGHRKMEERWLQLAEESIERIFEEGGQEKLHIQGHIAAVRSHTAFVDEDIPRILEMGQKALDLLPDGDEMRCEAAIAMGCAYWGLGDVIQSEQAFGLARATALKAVHKTMAVPATCYVGMQQVKQGHLQEAIATFRDSLRLATLPDGTETPIAGFPGVKLGDVYLARNELDLASHYLRRGVENCIRLNQPDFLTDAYVCLSRYQLAIGNLDETFKIIQKADYVAQQTKVDPWVLCWLDDCRLKAWLADGNLEAATLWSQNSGLSTDGPMNFLYDLPHQNLARVLVAQGILGGSRSSLDEASALLLRLQRPAEKAGWIKEEIIILVLQALSYHAQGMDDAAIRSLARAVSLAEPGGYVRVFIDEGDSLRDLIFQLDKVLEKGSPTARIQLGINLPEEQLRILRRYILTLLSAFDHLAAQKTSAEKVASLGGPVKNSINKQPASVLIEPLSDQELKVLHLLNTQLSVPEIAREMVVAPSTTRTHVRNIYEKLCVHGRMEAVLKAKEIGLI